MVNTYTINKTAILKPLTKILGVAGKRSTLPVLANVLVELTPEGSTITATDLEICAVMDLGIKPENRSTFLVRADKFADVLKELDDGDIDLSVNAAIMDIKQKATAYKFSLQDVKDFPEIPSTEEGTKITVKAHILKTALDKVDFAMSRDESRVILNGLHLDFQGNRLIAVATDGFRLSCYGQFTDEDITMPGFVIPRNAVSEIRNIILSGSGEEQVTILKTANKVVFKTATAVLACNFLVGEYPDYKTVMPQGNPNIISVEKEQFLKGVKKVGSISVNNGPIKLRVASGTLDISAESDLGKSVDAVDAVYTGTEFTQAFNIRFLLDMLPRIPDDRIVIEAPKDYGAFLFKGENSPNYANIVMPIRL